ncbi:hypothetical protein D9M68_732200 [compost metagenome]
MIFTVAQVTSPARVAFDPQAQELSVQFKNPHRASGGRTLQVRFAKEALKELIQEIRQLEADPSRPLDRLFES